jgi:hypothetical protein
MSTSPASAPIDVMTKPVSNPPAQQLLHLVFGGELESVGGHEFKDLEELDIVGIFPNSASVYAAWKGERAAHRR